MAWSQTGSVASFPSQLLTDETSTEFVLNLMFRADEAAGIVYVTGNWSASGSTTAHQTMNTVPLLTAFRPLTSVTLESQNTTSAGGVAPLVVRSDGTVACANHPTTAGIAGKLRHFYFTTVTPA